MRRPKSRVSRRIVIAWACCPSKDCCFAAEHTKYVGTGQMVHGAWWGGLRVRRRLLAWVPHPASASASASPNPQSLSYLTGMHAPLVHMPRVWGVFGQFEEVGKWQSWLKISEPKSVAEAQEGKALSVTLTPAGGSPFSIKPQVRPSLLPMA